LRPGSANDEFDGLQRAIVRGSETHPLGDPQILGNDIQGGPAETLETSVGEIAAETDAAGGDDAAAGDEKPPPRKSLRFRSWALVMIPD